jgi:hypothetical protein
VKQFSFKDKTNGWGVIDANNTLRFFIDDTQVPNETTSGAIARLRIYKGVLSKSAVAALDREP